MLETSCLFVLDAHTMLSEGDRVLVALSGGPDSVALLHFLHQVAPRYRARIFAVHVNHQLRAEDADKDALFCERLCKELEVPFSLRCLDVKALKSSNRIGTQEAARVGRYRILLEEAERIGANKLAVGQNLNDQAETVIHRLLRGTGPQGLAGIWPKRLWSDTKSGRRVEIIRPLLQTTRQEIMEYLQRHGLEHRLDQSNVEPVYTRNKIRLCLMPVLYGYNPGVERALSRLARLVYEQNLLVDELTKPLESLIKAHTGGVRLDTADMKGLSEPVRRHLFRMAVRKVRGHLRGLGQKHLDYVYEVALGTKRAADIPGLRIGADQSGLVLTRHNAEEQVAGFDSVDIDAPGTYYVEHTGLRIDVRVVARDLLGDQVFRNPDPNVAYVDNDRVSFPLTIRSRRDGDRFCPLGLGGSKKVKDFLIAKKLALESRDALPVFTDATGAIIWLGGLAIDDRFKIGGQTTQVLVLSIERT